MDLVNQAVSLVKNNWVEVLAVIGAIDIILGVVVKFTPVKWDDNLYVAFHNAVAKLGKK